jgi:hypothetical protein
MTRHETTINADQVRAIVARDMSERDLQQWVIGAAQRLGYMSYHTFDSRRSEPGFPDLVMVRPPRLLFVELKRQSKSPTAEQQRWLDALADRAGGAEVYVWRPMDWLTGQIEHVLKGETT